MPFSIKTKLSPRAIFHTSDHPLQNDIFKNEHPSFYPLLKPLPKLLLVLRQSYRNYLPSFLSQVEVKREKSFIVATKKFVRP